ncbi:MAG TPA: hypothetical protein ENN21_08040, partial [Spirochaetes bacterium]|nr:hypothetical protein [Spirochaetota bacterium]
MIQPTPVQRYTGNHPWRHCVISERRYREIAGIFIFLAGLMLLLSLCTYSGTDMEMLRTNRPVHNLVGPLGAWIGNIGRIAFGYPSSIVAVILFFSGWHFIKKGDSALYLERVFSLSFFMITLSALFALIEPVAVPQNAGGYLGLYL